MKKKKIIAVIGTRPQFIKHFSFEKACGDKAELKTIHTGQHYDENMSQIFFQQLGMRQPDYHLVIEGDTHTKQTAIMMMKVEDILSKEKPDIVLVYGDTNSTLAGALTAAKLNIPVAHAEAGLRSFNREMPEEMNRVLTDHIATWLFVPGLSSEENLKKEGISVGIYRIGDVMKDLVLHVLKKSILVKPLIDETYIYATLHRPYNVDDKERLVEILDRLNQLPHKVIFSLHPRTRANMVSYGIDLSACPGILFIDPQPYFQNLGYIYFAEALITDSGGMQKEAYWLQKKCITVRKETEWTETLDHGANTLVFEDLSNIKSLVSASSAMWDEKLYGEGNSCHQMVEILTR